MAANTVLSQAMPTAEERAAATATGMSIALWAKYTPASTAIISPTGDRSFHALNANANRLARALRMAGLSAGDSVAIVVGNRPEFAEIVFARQSTDTSASKRSPISLTIVKPRH
jgi:acyl-CoA synthetase (AMP-forming)/AMP-acid ligase II